MFLPAWFLRNKVKNDHKNHIHPTWWDCLCLHLDHPENVISDRMYVGPVCSDIKVTQYMYISICCKTATRGKKLREQEQMLPAPSIEHWHLNSLTWASEAIKNIFKIRRYLGCYFLLLLIYKNLHFFPSSQYPHTPPTPSPPPYIVLRAVRVSCPVWSSRSSRVLSGLGRWACKQTRIPQV